VFAPLTLAPVPADPPEPLFGNLGSTPALVERWLQESWLARMRWRAVLVGLALVPLFSTISPLLPALLALGLAVGNVRVAWLLRQAPDPARLRAVRRFATALEWTVGLGIVTLHAGDATGASPVILLVLLVLTGARYDRGGVRRAAVAIGLIIAGLVLAQYLALGLLSRQTAIRLLVEWELLTGLMTLVVRGLMQADGEWFRWQEGRRDRQSADLRRLSYGLSPQEWKVLPLLAQQDLTYAQIGDLLHIGAETVKTHKHRIGAKLGATGSRAAVVAAARARGLLPTAERLHATGD